MASRSRLGVVILTSVALAAALGATAPVAQGANTCRVRNATRGTSDTSLIRMVAEAHSGDLLRVRGTCPGEVVIRRDVVIRGLDGAVLTGRDETRVVRVERDARVTLSDLIIQRGSRSVSGGIVNRGRLRLVAVTVRGSHAGDSTGGIRNAGTLVMIDSVVRGNGAWYTGGLWNTGTATLRRTTVAGNGASDQGHAGGILNGGTITLIDSLVARNHRDSGGGAGIRNTGTLVLVRTVIRDNVIRDSASPPIDGLRVGGGIVNSGTVDLVGSTVTGNTAAAGGGIWNWDTTGTVTLDAISSVTGNTPDDCVGTSAC